jgi:plastocyanin
VAAILAGCGGLADPKPDPGTALIDIRDNYFQPNSMTVARGRVVRWTNRGGTLHRVVANDSAWQSPSLPTNYWFEVRFDSSGTFGYRCLVDSTHTETGVVIVQ